MNRTVSPPATVVGVPHATHTRGRRRFFTQSLVLWLVLLASGLDFAPAGDLVPEAGVENRGHLCLALAIYSEARGESWQGQSMIARVILNRQRALPYGADACDVVLAPGQFEGVERMPYPRRPWRSDAAAWMQAIEVTDAAIKGDYYIPPPCAGATFFRAKGKGRWGELKFLCTVGAHDFYSEQPATVASLSTGDPE